MDEKYFKNKYLGLEDVELGRNVFYMMLGGVI